MSGNPRIAQQREAAFRAELKDPNVWITVAAMMLSEGSPQQSVESLFNRVMYVRDHQEVDRRFPQTLMQMITSGFYGPYNRGEYPHFIEQIRGSQDTVNKLNAAIEAAMAGSDTIQGFTDQGLATDPNGQHQPQIHVGGNIFNDWGGGPGGHDGAAAWRAKFETMAAKAPLPPVTTTPIPPIPPIPAPVPAPAPLPSPPPVDLTDALIAMLKAAGKLPTPTINITTTGDVIVTINGVTMIHPT